MSINLRQWRIALLSLLALVFPWPSIGSVEPPRPDNANFVYDIVRDGKRVGEHELEIRSLGETTTAVARSQIRIGFLGFDVYRFDYVSEEQWDAEGLLRLRVEVNDNGERQIISGTRSAGLFVWTSEPDGERREQALPVYPTNHWDSRILRSERVLNTLTGRLNDVTIVPVGQENLDFPAGSITGNRYRYDGELELESFYDNTGRWLGMRFEGRDGSTIEYRCRSCSQRVSL
jgi:hypothetical protein